MGACPSHAGCVWLSQFPRGIVLRFVILGSDQKREQALFLVISLVDLEILIWLSFKNDAKVTETQCSGSSPACLSSSANLDDGKKKSNSHGDERTLILGL